MMRNARTVRRTTTKPVRGIKAAPSRNAADAS